MSHYIVSRKWVNHKTGKAELSELAFPPHPTYTDGSLRTYEDWSDYHWCEKVCRDDLKLPHYPGAEFVNGQSRKGDWQSEVLDVLWPDTRLCRYHPAWNKYMLGSPRNVGNVYREYWKQYGKDT